MKQFFNQVQNFLLNNNVWVFFAAIFFSSNMMLYQGYEHTWGNYFLFIFKVSIAFLPVLIFVFLKKWLTPKIPKMGVIGIWIYCFLIHPVVLELFGIHDFLAKGELGHVLVRLTATLFLIAETLILVSKYWKESIVINRWKRTISLEKVIWFSMLLFAVAYLAFGYTMGADIDLGVLGVINQIFQIFLILIPYYCFYYINHYFLFDKLLKQKGIIYYIFGFLATLIFLFPIAAQVIYFIPIVQQSDIHPVHYGDVFDEINWLVPFFGMLMSIPFIMTVRWFRQGKELADLAAEKSETELNLLKQQINPHFFFNTLNNLYSLSLTKDKQTPEIILQLSELMRYVIYKGKEKQVELKEEIKYIEDYVQLQQIRLAKKLDFKFEKSIDNEHLTIPPLLFITFVENALKHGVEPAENDCFLHLSLKTERNELTFICKNSLEEQVNERSGIGLKNLKRRLELRFPKAHSMEIEESKNQFIATLKITLN